MNKILATYVVISSIAIVLLHRDINEMQKQVDQHQEVISIHNSIFKSNGNILKIIIRRLNINYTEVSNGKRMQSTQGS